MDVAIGLAEGHALDLGEVFEPSNAQGSDRFVADIDDHVGGLVVVTVEGLLRFDAVLLHEADTANGVRVKQLLVGRHDLRADSIVAGGRRAHFFSHLHLRSRDFEFRGRIPKALRPEQNGRVRMLRDCVERGCELLHQLNARLVDPVEIDRFFAVGTLESEKYLPQPRMLR